MKWWTWWSKQAVGGPERDFCRLARVYKRTKIRKHVEQTAVLRNFTAEILCLLIASPAVAAEDERVARIAVDVGAGRDGWDIGGGRVGSKHRMRTPFGQEQNEESNGEKPPQILSPQNFCARPAHRDISSLARRVHMRSSKSLQNRS